MVEKQATKGIVRCIHGLLTMEDFKYSLAYAAGEHALEEDHIYCPDRTDEAFVQALWEHSATKICIRQEIYVNYVEMEEPAWIDKKYQQFN